MSKEIRISITSALNAAGIEATKAQVAAMSSSVEKSMAKASAANARHWADIKAAWDMGCSAIKAAWQFASQGLKSAFKFETQTTQFKTLIGDIDEAKAHMADLKALGDTPPFSLDEFAKASRSLMVMTDGALGYKKSMEMVGDAAAATGVPIEEMGQAVGRLYAFIRDGQPLSRATTQLRNMGVLTPEVAAKLDDLQKAGKSNAEIWAEVEKALGKYNGAMAATEGTGEGLIAAISTRWDNIVRSFGIAFSDSAKGGMTEVLDKMKELEKDGSIEIWARETNSYLQSVVEGATACANVIGFVLSTPWKAIKSGYEMTAQSVGNVVGTLQGGGGIVDAVKAGFRGVKEGFNDVWDADGAQAEHNAQIRVAAAERAASEEAEAKQTELKREEKERERIIDSLAKKQREKDKQNLKAIEKDAEAVQENVGKHAAELTENAENAANGSAASVKSGGGGGTTSSRLAGLNEQMASLQEQKEVFVRKEIEKLKSARKERLTQSSDSTLAYLLASPDDAYNGQLGPLKKALENAEKKFGTAEGQIKERAQDILDRYANAAPGSSGSNDAAARTAAACEGILKHFEKGSIA